MTVATPTVDKSSQRVRRMFGEIAPRYDALNHILSLNVDRYWRWQTVRRVPAVGKAPILDVCTGTGDLALAYARATDGETPIIAADFCPQMLALGEEKKRRHAATRQVAFVEADTMQLPFPDAHFQLVTVAFGLRNVADTMRGLREMFRVCQPGGRVAILEFSMPTWQPFKAIYASYFEHILPRIGQSLARNRQEAYSYLPASVGAFPSGAELASWMESAGFDQVAFHPLTLGIATLYIGKRTA